MAPIRVSRGPDWRIGEPSSVRKNLEERVDEYLFQEWIVAKLASFFSLLALSLTCLGLYGALAYAVGRRTQEIVKHGVWLTLIGVGLGLVAAFGVIRLLRGFLFDVNPTAPLTFASIALLLITTALLACYIPARRVSKVDPMIAIRYE